MMPPPNDAVYKEKNIILMRLPENASVNATKNKDRALIDQILDTPDSGFERSWIVDVSRDQSMRHDTGQSGLARRPLTIRTTSKERRYALLLFLHSRGYHVQPDYCYCDKVCGITPALGPNAFLIGLSFDIRKSLIHNENLKIFYSGKY
jgi:hypothetical protein